ncbi:AAA family ATPase [Pseudomonas fluorescens]|uniref:ATP-binding protein n=1 Tax=Pseudomonas fluorescens TaxID=294 RepID=A0A4Y9TF17_PSEFL|nr:ATP-binding protein [Pseudomonas fluorescens]TFW42671.1 ATP-binding protein [Pseudomonas fluorescens]
MPTLHLLCGKIASGKSTLAHRLTVEHGAILLSEDQWLAQLYPGEILSISDYLRCARRIRGVLGPLVINLLASGNNVALDFPANTLSQREWLVGLAQAAQVPHRLHYLELDDDTCRARLHARNARGDHDFAATDAEFDLITRHFCVPSEEEGVVIEVHRT